MTPAELRGRVRLALAGEPVNVRTGSEDAAAQAADLEEEFGFFRTALLVFGGIALFVGAFVIYNTFSITVAQRTRELALLRMLGATRRQVLRSVILEAFTIGLIASLLGLLGGLALVPGLRALFGAIGAELPDTASVIATRTIVVSLLVGVVVTVIASVVPALRATRIAPIEALREGLVAAAKAGRGRLIAASLLCLAGAGHRRVRALRRRGGRRRRGHARRWLGRDLPRRRAVQPAARAADRVRRRRAAAAPLRRDGRIARENATRNPARTAVTAAALMVGVALVVFVSIFAAGLQGSIDRAVDRSFAGDLTVGAKSGFGETPPAVAAAVRGCRASGP